MTTPAPERVELHHLADTLDVDQVRRLLSMARYVVESDQSDIPTRLLPSWAGKGHLGSNAASETKQFLRREMGQQ